MVSLTLKYWLSTQQVSILAILINEDGANTILVTLNNEPFYAIQSYFTIHIIYTSPVPPKRCHFLSKLSSMSSGSDAIRHSISL